MRRALRFFGLLAAAVGFWPLGAAAVVVGPSPVYLNSSGQPTGALAFICLNLDGSSCTFGGGGGGGAVTAAAGAFVDGWDATKGFQNSVAWDGSAASATQMAVAKYAAIKTEAVRALLAGTLTVSGNVGITGSVAVTGAFFQATQPVSMATAPTTPVTGTFFQATQPASEADGTNVALGSKADAATCATTNTAIACFRQLHADMIAATPAGSAIIGKVGIDQTTPGTTNGVVINSSALATGAATSANQSTEITSLASIATNTTGASTAAKQPALGTAGTPSADVLTVQGAASMIALKVDGSAVTQPVSNASLPLPAGASTSANQTTGNTSLATIATNTTGASTAAKQANLTTAGDNKPPSSASGKKTQVWVAVTLNTSTTLAAANANRVGLSVQCFTATSITVSETGATLTAATPATGNAGVSLSAGAYFVPAIPSLTAMTVYMNATGGCVVTEDVS